jgi:hypothetical protein
MTMHMHATLHSRQFFAGSGYAYEPFALHTADDADVE